MQFFHTITGHGENLSLRIKHDSSHGHFPMTGSLVRGIERHLHGAACIGLNHDAMMRCMTLSRPSRFQNSAPLIGLTLDHEPGGGGKFSRYPFHALRENYLTALSEAGGLPVCLGYTADAEAMVARLDALVITGGAFDVDPALYDEDPHPLTSPRPARTSAELALLRAALKRDIPILGICGGMQLIAVNAGGTLIQHLPPELEHEQPNPRHEPGHAVSIVPDTRLAEIVGMPTMMVNSSHHQAVRSSGEARISALAPDGVIEAIELDGPKFAIGVQWHPEFTLDPGDRRLYAALVEAAAR
ncbi:glutamine amidotransferase-like protein [Gluconobacter japonicus NBRC 3271]|nr:glutamine amidotransferase-like protein [Gluconobacter japonicus NBRC 3271]